MRFWSVIDGSSCQRGGNGALNLIHSRLALNIVVVLGVPKGVEGIAIVKKPATVPTPAAPETVSPEGSSGSAS